MRIKTTVLAVLLGCGIVFGQVGNSASTLSAGRFSLGIAPVFYVGGHGDVGLYLNGGIGLARNMDLSLKLIIDETTYFGGDFEFVILSGFPTISLAAGMHSHYDLGLDATFNLTFPIRRIVSIYTGLDGDINFGDNDPYFPFWAFVGFQAMMRRSLGIFMEIDIGISNPAPDMFMLGLNVFF